MKLINMFENPNMSQALMAEWADARQLEAEDQSPKILLRNK